MVNCPLEAMQQSDHSIGPINDVEFVSRGGIAPQSANLKTGKVKPAVIHLTSLRAKQLSVWRWGGKTGWELDQVEQQIRSFLKPEQKLAAVVSANVGEIRNLKRFRIK